MVIRIVCVFLLIVACCFDDSSAFRRPKKPAAKDYDRGPPSSAKIPAKDYDRGPPSSAKIPDDPSASARHRKKPAAKDYGRGPSSDEIPALCVETVGGNANGKCCKFPFKYMSKEYHYCTNVSQNKPWCATTSDYGRDRRWGFCRNYADSTTKVPMDKYNFAMRMGKGDNRGGVMTRDDIRKINMTLNEENQFNSSVFASTYRRGSSSETHMCGRVTSVPRHLTFITKYGYYYKYTHAYGIPIVSSNNVPNSALNRACYVLRFLLADRQILRKYLYWHFGRIGIIGQYEGTVSIPEHRWLGPSWNQRARGLGGTLRVPISTGCEENLLCYNQDRYRREDIFLHEFSHGIQEIAIRGGGIRDYFARLTAQYNWARSRGLWYRTYAMSTVQEYFAEGTQSYFGVNDESYERANGVHGPVYTRAKLKAYDIGLYNLIREVFPCENQIHDRCSKKAAPTFRMNCDGTKPKKKKEKKGGKKKGEKKKTTDKTGKTCKDKNRWCRSYKKSGYCNARSQYYKFMMTSCCYTCGKSKTKPTKKTGGSCRDKGRYCGAWAKEGFCKRGRHVKYMTANCKKSCKLC